MSRKLTLEDLQIVAKEKNHEIRVMAGYENVDSNITVYCKTCDYEWACTVRSYKNSKQTGCPNYKKRKTSETHKNKEVSDETRKKIGTKAAQRPGSLRGVYGEAHPTWKGGYGRDFKHPSTADYFWKMGVSERCQYKCILSGLSKKDERLVCHHLRSWNANVEERWNWYNGVLLTFNIHNEFHRKYKFGNNTEEQFADYVERYHNKDWESIKEQLNTWKPSAKLREGLTKLKATTTKLEESEDSVVTPGIEVDPDQNLKNQ